MLSSIDFAKGAACEVVGAEGNGNAWSASFGVQFAESKSTFSLLAKNHQFHAASGSVRRLVVV